MFHSLIQSTLCSRAARWNKNNSDNNDNNFEDNNKTMYMKHVKDMLLNKPSYELSMKQ